MFLSVDILRTLISTFQPMFESLCLGSFFLAQICGAFLSGRLCETLRRTLGSCTVWGNSVPVWREAWGCFSCVDWFGDELGSHWHLGLGCFIFLHTASAHVMRMCWTLRRASAQAEAQRSCRRTRVVIFGVVNASQCVRSDSSHLAPGAASVIQDLAAFRLQLSLISRDGSARGELSVPENASAQMP